MKIRQSMHGFKFLPYPCLGCFTTLRYSSDTLNTFKGIPKVSTAFWEAKQVAPRLVQVQKTVIKLRASSSIPCSIITLAASVLSSPPDRRAMAFILKPHSSIPNENPEDP